MHAIRRTTERAGAPGANRGLASYRGSGAIRPIGGRWGMICLMGFLDRLLGRTRGAAAPPGPAVSRESEPSSAEPPELTDEQALERYRYLVRTAPPDAIERAHEEAFARLTPEQRQAALRELSASVPEHERTDADDPRSLARMATRAEVREPGTVERAFGGARPRGLAGMGSPLLGSFAAAFAGSLVAQSLFAELSGEQGGDAGAEGQGEPADAGATDAGAGGDVGGDFGGFGGDVGI
jgi:hypothetical protein